jgi:hypothetical protein
MSLHVQAARSFLGKGTVLFQIGIITWFERFNPPTKSSTYCLLFLIKTTSEACSSDGAGTGLDGQKVRDLTVAYIRP